MTDENAKDQEMMTAFREIYPWFLDEDDPEDDGLPLSDLAVEAAKIWIMEDEADTMRVHLAAEAIAGSPLLAALAANVIGLELDLDLSPHEIRYKIWAALQQQSTQAGAAG